MPNTILVVVTALLFTGFSCSQEEAKLKFVPARVTGVKNGIDNNYFAAVKDESSPTGWAVQVKQDLNRYRIDSKFLVYMFDETERTGDLYGKAHTFFGTFLCDLLISNSRFDQFPQHNNMARDIIDLILPGRQGNCNLTAGTKPILSSARVNVAEYDNPKIKFPNSSYFHLFVNVLSQSLRDDIQNNYFFQVELDIGDPPQASGYACLDTHWNYYIVWRICTIVDFVQSSVFAVGSRILRVF